MSASRIKPELIHLRKVNVLSEKLELGPQFREQPGKVETVRFGFGMELANILEQGLTRIRLLISLDGMDQSESVVMVSAAYELEFHFQVENFSEFLKMENDGPPLIDSLLGATLVGIAFSTARGIVYERTKRFFPHDALLPVIDPHRFLMETQAGERQKSTEHTSDAKERKAAVKAGH